MCGPKLSFQALGRGAATLPFDWIRLRFEGLMHFLAEDFSGFFDFGTELRLPVQDCSLQGSGGRGAQTPLRAFGCDQPGAGPWS